MGSSVCRFGLTFGASPPRSLMGTPLCAGALLNGTLLGLLLWGPLTGSKQTPLSTGKQEEPETGAGRE